VTALISVTEDLRSAKAEGKATIQVLLDISKSFGLINHGLFVHSTTHGMAFILQLWAYGLIISSRSFYGL
jgi:hypothetical protein